MISGARILFVFSRQSLPLGYKEHTTKTMTLESHLMEDYTEQNLSPVNHLARRKNNIRIPKTFQTFGNKRKYCKNYDTLRSLNQNLY